MSVKTWIIALASASIIIMFQNCAKNPNLNQAANSSSSASIIPPPAPLGQIPVIMSSAQNITVSTGAPVDVTIQAQGTGLQYQWTFNGTATGNSSDTLSIPAAAAADAGTYTLNVSNAYGTVPVSFTLTVTPAAVVIPAPVITTDPVDLYGVLNTNLGTFTVTSDTTPPYDQATFSVTATGSNLTYQWYTVDSAGTATAIQNANQATYSFAVDDYTQAGDYRVVVSNSGGVAKADATLAIHIMPVIDPYPTCPGCEIP